MFSLLWSEHCAYKHSRKLLRRLPTEGERVVMGPGENAGAVDIGNGYAIAFKVESHNHPSAVEPFQGAATGVGGILRDVFALGARPIAILDSLRFGELDSERSRYLLDGAVRGIGHYGNSIGVATVGGEIYFEEPYEHNCLVNAMCVGIARQDEMVRAAAAGVGNAVVLMGASTGRDGIGGASVLASAELGEGDEAKRPTVQIGDPFEESKLLECCLELLGKGLLVSLQDLGAAGLTSSAAEMASAGGVGIDLDVARVPLREADMEPFEIMVSESQERMLAVVEPARVAEVLAVCENWQTGVGGDRRGHRHRPGAGAAGRRGGRRDAGRGAGRRLPPLRPQPRPSRRAGSTATGRRSTARRLAEETLLALLASPSVASKRWAFEQYDSVVGSRTVRRPESADAAVLQIPEAGNAIAVSIDGNGRRVACDPYAGTVEAVLECAQNLACVGAEPLGLTNCLNFGNPEKPAPGLAARPRGQRPRRRLRGARRPRRRRQRLPLQRGAGRPDLPDPGGRHGRRAARPGARRRLAPSPPRATRSPCVGPFAPTLAGSELAKLRGELDAGLPQPDIDAVAAACAVGPRRGPRRAGSPPPTTSATAASPARSPSRAIAGGLGCRVDLQPLRERGCSPGGGALRRGRRAASCSAASAAALEEIGATLLGEVGGDDDRDRRRRPQPRGRPRRRRERLALAAGAGRAPTAPEASAAKTAKR